MTAYEFDVGRAHIRLDGFRPESVKYLLRQVEELRITDAELKWEEVFNAHIDALLSLPDGTMRGGVFTADGQPVPFAQVKRSAVQINRSDKIAVGGERNPTPALDAKFLEEAIFGGVLSTVYGHIILETINRLWCAAQLDHLPILFLSPLRPEKTVAQRELIAQIAGSCGICPARIVFISDPTIVRRLIVPEPGLELGISTNTNYLSFLRSIAKATGAPPCEGRSVYVSRSKLPDIMRKPLDEAVFEDLLKSCGMDVVWPEQQPFVKQVALFNNYQDYVAFIGSQMHTLVFRDDAKAVRCVYFCNESPSINFIQIDATIAGDRLYTVGANYQPLYDFGNRCPFIIDYYSASSALRSIGHILPDKLPGADIDDYIYRWGYSLFYHKFFRKWTTATKVYGIDQADRDFEFSLENLTSRLAASNAPETAGSILLKAFDDVATWYKVTSPSIVSVRQRFSALVKPEPVDRSEM